MKTDLEKCSQCNVHPSYTIVWGEGVQAYCLGCGVRSEIGYDKIDSNYKWNQLMKRGYNVKQ